jgi:hypothetical protein
MSRTGALSAMEAHGDSYFQKQPKMKIAKEMMSRRDNKEAK